MIIVTIVKGLLAVLKWLISPLNLPQLTAIDDVIHLMSYISTMAYNMVYFILPKGTVSVLFTILLIVIAARHIYSFVMWVIRKIPGGMS
jgi:hypothetical protein